MVITELASSRRRVERIKTGLRVLVPPFGPALPHRLAGVLFDIV